MPDPNYHSILLADASPDEVFTAINDIRSWWSEDFKGISTEMDREFSVEFGTVHFSKQKVTELIPGRKIVWLVTESNLSFLQDPTEWKGTTIEFHITPKGNQSQIEFIHVGLTTALQCFRDCSNGWQHYLQGSLIPFINTGIGNPNILSAEIESKETR